MLLKGQYLIIQPLNLKVMDQIVLKRLLSTGDYPCVSILMPTHRTAPENQKDAIRLKKLCREAEDRLIAEFPKKDVEPILENLKTLVDGIDTSLNLEGQALFISKSIAEKIDLPFKVLERVVINHSFAIRDIIMGINRSPHYFTLVLSANKARLFESNRDQLTEVFTNGFPMISDLPLYEFNPTDLSREKEKKLKDFFNRVDKAYHDMDKSGSMMLTLVGVQKNIGYFREVTNRRNQIIAWLEGNYDDKSAHEIGKHIWPLVKEHIDHIRHNVLKELNNAVGAHKYVSGLNEVWRMADEGRMRLLIVEEGFRQMALLNNDNSLVIAEGTPFQSRGYLNDVVDDVAEKVIETGGRVVFVDDGSLKEHQRIAAVLRY